MANLNAPSITFGGTAYGADKCFQAAKFSESGSDVTYLCNGRVKHLAGNGDAVLTFSIAVEKDDVTAPADFAYGSTGTCEYHQFGDVTGNIERTTTNATVTNVNVGGDPNTLGTLDVTIVWDDLTTGAAV